MSSKKVVGASEINLPSQFSRTTRSLTSDSSRYALIAWCIGGVSLFCWIGWFVFGGVTLYEVSRKARLEVVQAPHTVASLISGKLVGAELVIGREVRAGDVLVELDASAHQLRLREEQVKLDAYPAKIASLQKEIVAMEGAMAGEQRTAQAASQTAQARTRETAAAAEFAADNERRLKEESSAGSVAQIEALRALAESRKLNAAKDALTSDVRRLELDAQTRASQSQAQIEALRRTLLSLESELGTAQATVERLKLDIERHRIRAPVSGRIGELQVLKPGAYVAEGQKLATVIPGGEMVIIAEFNPASAMGRVLPGQSARLRLDGFPWAQYGGIDAKVLRVAGELRDGSLRVELSPIAKPANAALMQHGLSGTVEVSTERIPPGTLLLRAAGQILAQPPRPPAGATPQ